MDQGEISISWNEGGGKASVIKNLANEVGNDIENGWGMFVENDTLVPTWPEFMSDVDGIKFYFGDHEMYYFDQYWSVGIDNPTIIYDKPALTESMSFSAVKSLFNVK